MYAIYGIGSSAGGFLAARLVPHFGWQLMYYLYGMTSVAFSIVLYCFLPESLRFMALGRIINNGRLGGDAHSFDFFLHATRCITYIGPSFRTRTTAEIASIMRSMYVDLAPVLKEGKIGLPIDSVFPLNKHRRCAGTHGR
jgi:MFS family permease